MKRIEETAAVLDRRAFLGSGLKLGALSTTTLAVTAGSAGLMGCGGKAVQAAEGYRYLRDADLLLFTAITPIILAPVKADANFNVVLDKVLQRVDELAYNIEPTGRKTIYQLLDLLNMRLTRWLATGLAAPWQEATTAEIEAFLDRWCDSSFELFNVGYKALTKFVTAAYFSLEESQAHSQYPGPPAWAVQAVAEV